MEKITKLATIVAKAARMEKKASDYKGKVAELLNDINDPNPLIDYISESDAKKICEELDIPHEASWYKGDLRGYVEEIPDGMVDVLIEYISESDARSLWRNINSSKQNKLHKKAEWSEDNFQGLWDMSFANRIVFKSILKNMSLEQQSNFSKWMQANKTEDEIRAFNEKYTLDELLSSKKVKLNKKAESELSDYVEQIRNKGEKVKYEIDKIVERYKYRLDNTFGQADAKKYGIEVYHKLDETQKLINSIYKIIG